MSFFPLLILCLSPHPTQTTDPGLGKGPELGSWSREHPELPRAVSLWLLREQARCLQCLQSAISNVPRHGGAVTTKSLQTSKKKTPGGRAQRDAEASLLPRVAEGPPVRPPAHRCRMRWWGREGAHLILLFPSITASSQGFCSGG